MSNEYQSAIGNIEFFILGCKLGAYKHKEWVLNVFCNSDIHRMYKDDDHYPMRVYATPDGQLFVYADDYDKTVHESAVRFIQLNGKNIYYGQQDESQDRQGVYHEPIVMIDESIHIDGHDIDSLVGEDFTQGIDTTPGIFFLNYYCFYYAFGRKVPYQKGPNLKLSKIANEIASQCLDDSQDDGDHPNAIFVKEVKQMISAMLSLGGFVAIDCPSATPYTMTPSEEVIKLKKALLAKYKDKLNDPVVIAEIEKQLVEADKKYIDQDPDKGFYIKAKSMDIVRKKLHYMQGMQKRMDESKPPVLLDRALGEQMDLKKIPVISDGIREGSFFRGAMTALGGEQVKFIYRIYSAATVEIEDCGSRVGIRRHLTEDNVSRYYNTYLIVGDEDILLTPDNASTFIGKDVVMRSPALCKADPEGRGYCHKCFGPAVRGFEHSLAAYGASVTSEMNSRFMASKHAVALKSTAINFDNAIS